MNTLIRDYDVPAQLLAESIHNSLLTGSIRARVDTENADTLYTEAYVRRQKHTLRAALRAVTKSVVTTRIYTVPECADRLQSRI